MNDTTSSAANDSVGADDTAPANDATVKDSASRHDAGLARLEQHIEALLPKIQDLEPWTVEHYSEGESGHLHRYRRLARRLYHQFRDEPLAMAGFLHGIAPEQLSVFQSLVSEVVFKILEGWEELVAVGDEAWFLDKSFSDKFEASIQLVPDARSAVLLVMECLDRLDPGEHLTRWNQRFRRTPLPIADQVVGSVISEQELSKVERYGPIGPIRFVEHLVAPAARAWGLWLEYTVLRDALLLIRDRARFEDLFDLAADAHYAWCAKRVRRVYEGLRIDPALEEVSVYWEWRHLASISEQLGRADRGEESRSISRCGFVTVVCPSPETCYRALWRIHQEFKYRAEVFRDSIGQPRRSGYQAIHTGILDPFLESIHRGVLMVRLVPEHAVGRRFEATGPDHLATLQSELTTWRSEEVQVFTSKGEARYVPPGTTVMEFAATMIPMDFPTIVQARVNDQLGDTFRVLRAGDRIEFVTGKPEPLPKDWQQRVSSSSIARIEWAMRIGYGPLLERAARAWLREGLEGFLIDDLSLDVFFEAALTRILAVNERGEHDTGWWLRQVGTVNRQLREEPVPRPAAISRDRAAALVRETASCFQKTRSLVPILDANPTELREIRWCKVCNPTRNSQLVLTERQGVLSIHREGELCSRGAEPLVWQSVTAGQIFHIEMLNEAGRLQEVLSVFARRRINVRESIVRTLGPRWGIARFEIEPTGPKALAEIERELGNLEDVRAFGPGQQVPPLLRQSLPPKVDDAQWLLSSFPEPFVCGPVIREPYHFYGRGNEMRQIHTLVDAARRSPSTGELAFVSGPLKAGKTSLVQRVQAVLSQSQELPTICAYHKTADDETWEDVQAILASKVWQRAEELAHRWSPAPVENPSSQLLEALAQLKRSVSPPPTFVLAVDEVVRLLEQTSRSESATQSLLSFWARIQRSPGVVVLWIGPSAPVYRLDRHLGELLEDRSRPIPVGPLSPEETGYMIRAQKLSLFHEIEVGPRIVGAIHRETGGDPFWTAHLGNRMWRIVNAEQPGRRVRFNHEVLRRAKEDLIHYSTPFRGRLFPSGLGDPRERAMATLLFALADLEAETGTSAAAFELDAILNRLAVAGEEPSPAVVTHQLDEMVGRGGVRRGGGKRWRLAVPLVRAYIEALRETWSRTRAAQSRPRNRILGDEGV